MGYLKTGLTFNDFQDASLKRLALNKKYAKSREWTPGEGAVRR